MTELQVKLTFAIFFFGSYFISLHTPKIGLIEI